MRFRELRLALAAVGTATVAIVGATEPVTSAVVTALLLVGGVLLATTLAARAAQRPDVSLDRHITFGGSLAVGQTLLAAVLFAVVGILGFGDALLIVLVSAFAGLLGLLAVLMTTRRLVSDVRAVRQGLDEVGGGVRDGRVKAEASRELVELADSVNSMTERLSTEEGARRELVAAISHDLRTPLTSMRLLIDALGDEIVDPDERGQYLNRLRLHVSAMRGLIEDLFEISRLEAGEESWSFQHVDVAMLAGDTVDAMRADAHHRQVEIECSIQADLVRVRANPEKLQRVLFNLLQNAIRHSPLGETVMLRAERNNHHVEVEIADVGAGIPLHDRERVFDAFVQISGQSTRVRGGAGLGLAISRAIVNAHGGRIWLADTERGTCVRFSLPIVGD